jgi:5-methylcytosine-specific restriction endonuclease McrA
MSDGPHYISGTCANCDSLEVTLKTPLFCSPRCRQAAELVRYVRACHRDGRDQIPDIKEAIQLRMAMVLGGGYPESERRVAPETRQKVFERANGHCENCGRLLDFEGMTGDPDALPTIQHIRGNSSELANLSAFCRRCNVADAQTRFVPVEPGSSQARLAADLMGRCSSILPLRLCDDEQHWSSTWRQVARSAREVIRERAETDDALGDEDLPGFAGLDRSRNAHPRRLDLPLRDSP